MPQRPGGDVQCRVLGGVCSRAARRAAWRLLLSSATVQLRELHSAVVVPANVRVVPRKHRVSKHAGRGSNDEDTSRGEKSP